MRRFAPILLSLCLATRMSVGLEAVPVLSAQDERRHSVAVEMARDGEWTAALRELAELRRLYPDHRPLLIDEIVVLAWSGQDAEAVQRADALDPASIPDYALGTIAKAHRNLHNYDDAVRWYEESLARDPDSQDARSGLAMTLADAGDTARARQVLSTASARQPESPEDFLTLAYVLEREGRFLDALDVYSKVLESEPGNRTAVRGKALVLRSLLMPSQALTIANDYPGALTSDEVAQLEADVIALKLRYASRATYPEDLRFSGIDSALSDLDRELDTAGLEPAVRRRLIFDRIVSLGDRLREEQAVREFEDLDLPMAEMPTYLLASAGTSYLRLRRPEQARALLEEAIARDPDNLEYQFQVFFVYADLEAHDRALEIAISLRNRLEPVKREPGSPVVKGSDDYLRAAILQGLAAAYADRLGESQVHLEGLLARVPNNLDVRSELATVYRWRGWIDRSMYEYAQILTVDPGHAPARIGAAHAKLDGQYFDSAADDIAALNRSYPGEGAVNNLDARWQLHRKSELRVDASTGENSGNTFGQNQYSVDALWVSRPFSNRVRGLLLAHDSYAEFPEGEATRRRIGAGIDYRYRRWSARASLTAGTDGDNAGLRAQANYRLNDTVGLGARLESESNATPLRGARVGVSSTLVGADIRWTRNESTRATGSIDWLDLTDGNRSVNTRLAGEHRLLNLLTYDLTALASADLTVNDLDQVNYFSPLRSMVWQAGLRNDHQIYRRYDLQLLHSLIGRYGVHDQQNFGSSSIWSVEYQFRARVSDRFRLYVGVSRASNVYDGDREYRTAFLAGFEALL